jgi:predicted DNA-binding protein (UPF0251 family)
MVSNIGTSIRLALSGFLTMRKSAAAMCVDRRQANHAIGHSHRKIARLAVAGRA